MEDDSIYVGLFRLANNPSQEIKFHWCLLFAASDELAYKVHATDTYGSWKFDIATHSVGNSVSVCALVKIGEWEGRDLDKLFKNLEANVPIGQDDNGEPFTCRIWVRNAVREMNRLGVISCADAVALENEVYDFGRQHSAVMATTYTAKYRVFSGCRNSR